MACLPDLKTGRCIVWCTELPNAHRSRESPMFLFGDKTCYFFFVMEEKEHVAQYLRGYYFCVYLKQVKSPIIILPFSVEVHVGVTKGSSADVFSTTVKNVADTETPEVWSMKNEDLQSRVKPDVASGNTLKFVFIFDDLVAFPLQSETGDKSIQASILTNSSSVQAPNAVSGSKLCLESLSEDYGKLLDGDPDYDVVLKCGERAVQAHGTVLRARSSVLEAMLEDQPNCLELQDMDEVLFQDFVRYLYSGTMSELSGDVAKKLYAIGDQYGVDGLKKRCAIFMAENLSPENACECLALADAHNDPDLKDCVVPYILDNRIPLLVDHWLPFAREHPLLANGVLYRFYQLQKKV